MRVRDGSILILNQDKAVNCKIRVECYTYILCSCYNKPNAQNLSLALM